MGKRKKSSRGPQAKKREELPSTFTCLFCNHENSVNVKLDKKAGVGSLECKVCGQKFQCSVNYLSAAVDVYGEWVDAADTVAKEDTEPRLPPPGSGGRLVQGRSNAPRRIEEEDEGEGGYGGDGVVGDDDYD